MIDVSGRMYYTCVLCGKERNATYTARIRADGTGTCVFCDGVPPNTDAMTKPELRDLGVCLHTWNIVLTHLSNTVEKTASTIAKDAGLDRKAVVSALVYFRTIGVVRKRLTGREQPYLLTVAGLELQEKHESLLILLRSLNKK